MTNFTLSKIHDLSSCFSISAAEINLLARSSIPLKALAGQDTGSDIVFTVGTHTDLDRSKWGKWSKYAETLASALTFAINSATGGEITDGNIQDILIHAADRLEAISPTIATQIRQHFLDGVQAIKTTYESWTDPCWPTLSPDEQTVGAMKKYLNRVRNRCVREAVEAGQPPTGELVQTYREDLSRRAQLLNERELDDALSECLSLRE